MMLPQELQQLFSAATLKPFAYVIIDGLGICCFNKADPKNMFWEVAFLRHAKHRLKIDVSGTVYEISPDAKTIDFLVDNGTSTHYDTFGKGYLETNTKFYRTCGYQYDFRWVPNFVGGEVPHGKFKKLWTRTTNPKWIGVTLARIPHSLFLTHSVSEDFVVLASHRAKDKAQGMVFGATNEEVGAYLFASKPGDVKIVVGNGGSGRACDPSSTRNDNCVINAPYKKGEILTLRLTNMDDPKRKLLKESAKVADAAVPQDTQSIDNRRRVRNFLKGDFSYYYQAIDVTGGNLILLAPRRANSKANRLGDCNIVRVVSDEINSLARLIE